MSEALELLTKELREIKEAMASRARDEDKLAQALDDATNKADDAKTPINPLVTKTSDEANDLADLMRTKAVDDKSRRLQELNDSLYTMKQCGIDIARTKAMREFNRVKAAMGDGVSNYGSDWDPTTYSSRVIEAVEQRRQVAGIVQNISLPRSPYAHPTMGASSMPFLVGEATTDTAEKIPSLAAGTGSTTFTAKTLSARVPFSLQLDEDSIVAMQPALEAWIAKTMANGVETAIINGDTTGAAAGTYSTATDPRLAWNGFRYHALQATATTYDSSTFAEAAVLTVMGKIGAQYGDPNECVWLTSRKVAIKLLGSSAFPSFADMNVIGSAGANIKGFVGELYGSPVVVSPYMYDTLDTTGKEASSTYSAIVYFNKTAYALGTQLGVTISTVWDPYTLQYNTIGHMRADFQPWLAQTSTANRACAMGVKIS